MKFSSFIVAAMVLLAFGGCLINQNLTHLHVAKAPSVGIFADVCAPEGNPDFDCKKVMKSKWAMMPPNEPDPETGAQYGIPVALMGWWYFTAIMLWSLLIGRCKFAQRGWHFLLLLAVLVGCGFSLFYLYILFFGEMEAKCLWCMISHGINFLLLICALLLIPRRREAVVPGTASATAAMDGSMPMAEDGLTAPAYQPITPQTEGPVDDLPAEHPSSRLVLATVIAALAMVWCEYALTGSAAAQQRAKVYEATTKQQQMVIDEFYEDTQALITRYESQEGVKIPHRPDDPKRGEGDLLLPMVVFSDFQCPACRMFAKQIEETVEPAFDNLVRVYWKHMPWCTECNPHSTRDLHPQACEAAYAAEAARILGGNDAFWAAHDWLFEHQKEFARIDFRDLAKELKLDPDKFVETMHLPEIKERILEDADLAKKIGVKGTPTIYLWGRKVDRKMLLNAGFTKEINTRFTNMRNKELAIKKWKAMSPEEQQAMLKRVQQEKAAHGESTDADGDSNGS
jgi:protein-disulfide isomerase/uncharacterized membrane protein